MSNSEEKETRTPAPWDPFSDWDLFSNFGLFRDPGSWPSRLARRLGEGAPSAVARLSPSIDIAENDDAYVVTAELPGSKKDDITVEMHDRLLTIRGEKKSEREGKDEHSRWSERSYGRFSRSFTLPANASPDRVKADFDNGVLTIQIPKVEEKKPKVVSIG